MSKGVNVGNINIKFEADTKNLEKGFNTVNKLLKRFEKNTKKIDVKFNADTKGLEAGVAKATTIVNNLDKNIKGKEIGEKIGEDIGEGIEEGVEKKVKKIDFSKTFKGMEKIANAGIKKVTIPAIGLGTAAWKDMANFEDAMAKVDTIADTTKISLKELGQQAMDTSSKFGIDADKVAGAQYSSISAGVDTANVGDFTNVAGMASKGSGADIETVIDGLTTTLNSYNLESKYAINIADQMFTTQKLGKITFAEMAQYMGNVTNIASSLNVSTTDLFASMAALTKNGIKANRAVTGLKAAYSSILSPSQEAMEVAEQLGINFSASHLKAVGWTKFLEEVKEKTQGSEMALSKLFGSTEAVNSMLVLTGKGASDYKNAIDEIGNSAGATEEAYNKMLTSQEKLKISLINLKNAFKRFGEALTPYVEKITEKINIFANRIETMSDGTIERIIKVVGAFALFFPALKIVAQLGQFTFWLSSGIGKVGEIASKVGGIMSSTFSGGFTIGNLAVMVLIGSLAFFIGTLWKAEDESTITTRSIGDKFACLGERALGVLKFIGGILHSIISLIVSGVCILIEEGLDKINTFLKGAQGLADKLGLDWLSEKIGSGVDSINGAIGKLKEVRTDLNQKTRDILDDALYSMDSPMDAIMDKKVKKGKINIEGEIGGNKVTFIGKENNPFLFDNKGRLTQQAKDNLEKQREKEFSIEPPKTNWDKMEVPEMPELPEMPKFKDVDTNIDKLIKNMNKKVPKAAKTAKTEVDKLQEALKKLGDEFKNTSDSIRGSIGMFDRFKSKSTSSYRLLRNAREREKAFAERESILSSLSQRGLGDEIMAQLYKTSMDQLGDLKGLNRMTQEQLMEWARLQQSANASADRQAIEQVIYVNIDAANKNYDEIERELYRRLKVKGVTI